MTDNDIIKALKCCSNSCDNGFAKCDECPRFEEASGCTLKTMKDALDLINRQKVEIKRLQEVKEQLESDVVNANMNCDHFENLAEQLGKDVDIKLNYIFELEEKLTNAKAEAIKEFAERLKKIAIEKGSVPIVFVDIDNLVKEMTEQKE